jgi:crotonobetainyl-CoA:carnitine CoA-transferase CaiB-like acyl-CoA transferase
LQRNQTGAGQYLDISLLDGAFLMMILLAGISIAGKDPTSEQYLTGKLACYNLYRTSDNRYLALALLEPKFWNVFCAKLELFDLPGSQFQTNQNELVQIISQKIASRSLQDWIEYFSVDDVCITPVQSIEEALQSEYVKQRQLFTIVENPFGSLQQMRTPFVDPGATQKKAPGLGEHNREILEEAGYIGEEIDEFIRNKVV